MTGLRLAFVTRKFWPLVGDNELLVSTLAAELLHRGHRPTIVTPKYGKYWPTNVCVREAPVVRLPHPPPRTWGNVRFSFAVSSWLQQRQQELDAVIVSGPQEDALTALGALRSSRVAVILQEEIGLDADHGPRRFGDQLLRRLRGCDGFVRWGETTHAGALPAWLPPEKLFRLKLGVEVPPPRTPAARLAARQSLAEVNHDLAVAPESPVALCLAPLVDEAQLELLARAWRPVQSRWPEARLWIVGDGPTRGALFTFLSDLNLKYRVVLPGTFDDWTVLLQAADLLVQPAGAEQPSWATLEGLAAGLPVIQFHSSEPTTPLPDLSPGSTPSELPAVLHVPHAEPDQLAGQLMGLMENSSLLVRLGEQGRKLVMEQYQIQRMVDAYERLLVSLVAARLNAAGPA